MGLRQSRLDDLPSQLANATINEDPQEPRLYHVTVPGALREQNSVKADSREEALEKVRTVLVSKIEQAPDVETYNHDLEVLPIGGKRG